MQIMYPLDGVFGAHLLEQGEVPQGPLSGDPRSFRQAFSNSRAFHLIHHVLDERWPSLKPYGKGGRWVNYRQSESVQSPAYLE